MAPRRINGCQPPFTFIQVAAWIYQLITLIWFAVVAFGFLSGSDAPLIVTSVLWSIFAAVSIGCWFWCQLADPAVVDTRCITFKQHDSHYCAVCKKVVPGIDHHCKWLNTCVGTRTYFSFYLLTISATLLYTWQVISLALLMSVWRSPEVEEKAMDVFHEPTIGFYFVSAVGIALSLPPASFYSALAAFHTLLIYKGQTTYDYLIDRSKKQRLKREANAKAKLSQTKSSSSQQQQQQTTNNNKPESSKVANPAAPSSVVTNYGQASNDIKREEDPVVEHSNGGTHLTSELDDEINKQDSRPLLESRDTEVNVV